MRRSLWEQGASESIMKADPNGICDGAAQMDRYSPVIQMMEVEI